MITNGERVWEPDRRNELTTFSIPLPQASDLGTTIKTLNRIHAAGEESGPGVALCVARGAAVDFKREFVSTGAPDHVSSHDLVTLPYPTRFGLWRASTLPVPFLFFTNRMLVVQWTDSGGQLRTLLWEPSDVELGANTPYFAALSRRSPGFLSDRVVQRISSVEQALSSLAIDPQDIDYLAFDHLHTQDVRRLIGTTEPQGDISPQKPVRAAFPNAKLVVQLHELRAMSDLHPVQQPWYQPETYVDLDPERILAIDGDRLLGPGIAIVRTPGHATGNQSLVLNTSSGVWAFSENVIATECLTPEHSKIPGIARWAKKWNREVVINANTIESTAAQYNSCVFEKSLVDRAESDSRFLQFFPTSELTSSFAAPGIRPTFAHKRLHHRS